MSNYSDPRWYEQPEQSAGRPPAYNDLDQPGTYPAGGNNTSTSQRGPMLQPPPDRAASLRRALRKFFVTAALVVLAFLGGWFSHQYFSSSFALGNQSQKYEGLFQQAWTIVDQNYVDRSAVNYQQMSYNAIQAMLGTLKDTGHTRFLTPAEVQSFQQSLSPTLVGVGIYITQDPTSKQIKITRPIPNSPAEKAGIKPGDIIVGINGTNVQGKDLNTISDMLHGAAGTSVSLTVQRPATKQTLTFTMKRAEVQVQNVIMHYIPEKHIAHIQVIQFADGVTDQLKAALLQAKKLGATSIVLDLRGNPGGLVQEAINTASLFMKSGNVYIEKDSQNNRTPFPVNGSPVDTQIPIVVLVDNNTGSSAEIVSGALQDNHRAKIMGVKTFGTGTVLLQYNLSDGSAILLGVGEWLTPDGHFIRGQGITPDITVTLDPKVTPLSPEQENDNNMSYQQILQSGDTQLIRAIQYLETNK